MIVCLAIILIVIVMIDITFSVFNKATFDCPECKNPMLYYPDLTMTAEKDDTHFECVNCDLKIYLEDRD